MIKKIIMGMLILSLMVTFVACTAADTSADSEVNEDMNKLDKIKEKGKIVLGTAADYPPYEYHVMIDGKDEIVGFDIDIANKIAEELGVELEIVDMKFEGLLPALVTEDIDFIVAGMVADEERKESINFSVPYYQALQKFIVRIEDKDKLKEPKDFKGLNIGAQKSTIQEKIAFEQFTDAEYFGISKITDLVLELQNNKIDGVILAEPVAKAYVAQNTNLYMADIVLAKEDGVSVGINKKDDELLEKINEILQKLIDSGEVDTLIEEATKAADEV